MNQAPATEDQVLEALATVPAFSQLDERNRRKLAKLCTVRSFPAGDLLYEEGAMGLSLFIVTSGQVERYQGSGKKKVVVGAVGAGGVLGQLALLDGQPRGASAMALEATDCLQLTRDSFETLVKKEPQIAWCLTPALAGRIRELQSQAVAAELAREEAPAKPKATAEKSATAATAKGDESDGASEDEEDEHETSEIESAFFKMMRMQFGMMAGAAKCMTETSKVMEKFLDSMADETEVRSSEDWGDMMGKVPDAMVTATREAMDQYENVPQEMVDAYRRYSDDD